MERFTANLIYKYFDNLSEEQHEQIEKLEALYSFWNNQINVISRKDIDLLYERHVLHSLAIAKLLSFRPSTKVLDVGTGGGFPGIPLAILFPKVEFHLVDSIGKKIKVVNEVSMELGLQNVKGMHLRAEQLTDKYDFVVTRAVTRLAAFYPWVSNKFKKQSGNSFPNGMLFLKGGDLNEEISEANLPAELYPLSDFFEEDFFQTKFIMYVPAPNA